MKTYNQIFASSTKKSILMLFIGIMTAGNAAAGTKKNYVDFISPADITLKVISNNEKMITEGETLHNVTQEAISKLQNNTNQLVIMIEASRKKSTNVAESFNLAIGQAGKAIAKSAKTDDERPPELNFYAGYTLYINGFEATTLYVAQGSFGSYIITNNWWAGTTFNKSPKIHAMTDDCYITVKANNTDYYITAKDHSTFEVSGKAPTCAKGYTPNKPPV